ncbi:MAG: hypothetical protein JWM95_380 [Gemmatimonadetes bacterium]|nr:hypothetical protein [Gemmatimonadota bacterium]
MSFANALEARILKPRQLEHTAPNNQDPVNFGVTGTDRSAFEANLAKGDLVSGSTTKWVAEDVADRPSLWRKVHPRIARPR